MESFKKLLQIADKLLGPNGCPWDREQTLNTLQPYLLEETHELIEAIDLNDPEKIREELGDVLYALVFIAKLAEQKNYFTLSDSARTVADKLIRRHPHVFGNQKIESTDDVVKNWDAIKKAEGKKSPIDGIPPTLPALSRAQKVVSKSRRAHHLPKMASAINSEKELGEKLWHLVREADAAGFDAESALRRTTLLFEENLRNDNLN